MEIILAFQIAAFQHEKKIKVKKKDREKKEKNRPIVFL